MPTLEEISNKIDEQGRAFEALKTANDQRLSQIEKKGSADPLTTEQLSRINNALDMVAEHNQKMAQMENAIARTAKSMGIDAAAEGKPEQKAYAEMYKGYLRGRVEASELNKFIGENQKALSVNSDPDGGYLVTPAMSATMVKKIFESSPFRSVAAIETVSTDSLEFIDDHDEAEAEWVGETANRDETDTPQIAKRTIYAHELAAQPKATQKLIDDAAINVESWLAEKVADIFSRTENTAFASGNGVGKPRGILTYAAGTSWGQIEQISSVSSGAVTADLLVKMFYALKEDYSRNSTWMMNRTTVQAVRLLKEATTNAYMWQPSLQAGEPDSLLGRPLVHATDIPVAAADSLSVVLADFRRAYQIVDRFGIRVLRDPYTAKPFIKFYTTKRVGGDVLNFEAVKIGKLSAS